MKLKKLNQRQQAYETIRNAITFGELKPGARLIERDIMETFTVGRTPLREALRQLQMEDYVEVLPNRGAVISRISIRDIAEIYDVVSVLEGFATELAVKNLAPADRTELESLHNTLKQDGKRGEYRNWLIGNTNFHGYLVRLSNNHNLFTTVENLRKRIYRYRFIAITIPGHIEEYMRSHEQILNKIFKGDIEDAGSEMRKHVLHVKEVLVKFLQQYPAL